MENKKYEMFTLENDTYVVINGKYIKFGCRCTTEDGKYIILTNKEIEELDKEFRIKETGMRHMMAIELFQINGRTVDRFIPKKYLEQLEYMGYNISLLDYELLEEEC